MVANETETHENVKERDFREATLRFVIKKLEIVVIPHEHILIIVFLRVRERDLHDDLFHFGEI